MSLYQIRYSGRGPVPTAARLAAIRDQWLKDGTAPPGVNVRAMAWTGSAEATREAIARIPKRYAGRAGLVKCEARPEWTYCDYDLPRAPSLRRFWRFARLVELTPEVIQYDRTRRGWHVLIAWARALTPLEQVAIQAVLGSDYQREIYNLARVMSGRAVDNPAWNILFERKLTP